MSTSYYGTTTGAFRETWGKSPRPLLDRIVKENPMRRGETFEKYLSRLRPIFTSEVLDDEESFKAVVNYWLTNNLRSKILRKEVRIEGGEEGKKSKERIDAVATKVVVALLKFVMPNEKRLEECTGIECKQMGGWLTDVVRQMPDPSARVGDVLSEADVRAIFDRRMKKK